ncbi:MAG TPA: hypothetical protein VMW10_02200 [Alphaproteobacteria bacterium]|nr:hypothetical protein [Alphaproteobacteria bacterium]
MASTFHLGEGIRDNCVRVFCLVGLTFTLYYLYLDRQYKYYIEDYKNTQRQETQLINEKIASTILGLKTLAAVVGEKIRTAPEDSHKIQRILIAGAHVSQDYNVPTVRDIAYYKLSNYQEVITPSLVYPLNSLPLAFRKSMKDLESLITKNNEMIGTIPILDQSKRLKGVLEIKVPCLDIQKFIGADKVTTLEFPQLFDIRGKQVIQNNPLDFSFKAPLPYFEYLKSHEAGFLILAYAVLIGSILLFFCGILVKKRVSVAVGGQIDKLSTHRSSLEAYNSLQRHMIQRFKDVTRIIHHSVDRIAQSYNGSPLSHNEKRILINGATGLVENLSSGLCANLQREPLLVKELLDQVKLHFVEQIQKLNINLHMTCPQDLEFVGDPLFTKMILLNVIGYPLYSMPKKGEISISVTQVNGFVHVEIRDNRYSLTAEGKQHLKIPFEFFVEGHKLRQICIQNRIGCESFEATKGDFYTKVSFPLDPDQVHERNIIPFPR